MKKQFLLAFGILLFLSCEKETIDTPEIEAESDIVYYEEGNIVIPGNGNSLELENSIIYSSPNAVTIQAKNADGAISINTPTMAGIMIRDGVVTIFNKTEFSGKITVSDDSEDPKKGDIRFNDATNKHQGYDGINWNDLY